MISVVIPVKNGGEDLERCLAGIAAQRVDEEVEVVVVDSGSTDGSVEVARAAGAVVEEIHPSEFGHGRTRTLGVRLAKADVRHEDRDLDHLVHRAAARLDDLLDLLEDAACLGLDVALADQVAVLVVRELAGDVDGVADAPAERVARALVLHVGGRDRDACHAAS